MMHAVLPQVLLRAHARPPELTAACLALPACATQMREENPLPQQPAAAAAAAQQPAAAAAAADDPAKKEEAERRKAAEEGLPEGWAVAFNADKKPYYWHKQVGAGGRAHAGL